MLITIIGAIIIVSIYIQRYRLAKEKGEEKEWSVKVLTRLLWYISIILLFAAMVVGISSKSFAEELISLKWESVFLSLMAFSVNPFIVKRIWNMSKILAVASPILCSILAVVYIPFVTGSNITGTIKLIGIGVVGLFTAGVTVLLWAIVALTIIVSLLALADIPVVIAL